MMGQVNESQESNGNILAFMGVLISATNPEISKEERAEIIFELKGAFEGDGVTITKNNVEYDLTSSAGINAMFMVKILED